MRECGDLAEISREQWVALRARPPATTIGSPEWLGAALATTHSGMTPLLLAAELDGRLVGLLPLALDESGPGPVACYVGAPYNDLSDLLVLPGREREAAEAILTALRALGERGCAVVLRSLDPDGVLARADREVGTLRWEPDRPAPTVPLDGDLEAAISTSRRGTWRRKRRRLREAHAVELRWVEGEEAIAETDRFGRLREMRRLVTGRPPERPPVALVEEAIRRLAPPGMCRFADLLVDGEPAARDLYLIDPPVALLWLRGLDPAWQRYPCGHLLLIESADALARAGCEVLDMGRGAETYKFDFGAEGRVLLRASCGPAVRDEALPQSPPTGASVSRDGRRQAQ